YHGGVLVVVGHEISPHGGHMLAFATEHEIPHADRSEAQICAAVTAAGGIAYAAHPFSEGSRISARIGRPHAWRALDDCDCGVELWSLATDAAEACASVGDLVRLLRRPEPIVDGPPARHLRIWDRLCATRRVPALAGLDAHQTGLRIAGRALSPLPHARWFRLLQTNLLLDRPPSGDLSADRAAVHAALRAGRAVMVRRDLGDGRGFRFWAEGAAGAVTMGEEASGNLPATLHARLPAPARVRLLREGAGVAAATGDRLSHAASEPGAYRIEARVDAYGGERTWLVSNPVYLRG
ncbi:MAG TPA: hypothetical protein VFM58_04340, partial [Solirubrobacteraceae bacterium]|nr:hypothetical protein [Solirubrobacteraceae bacterium]